MTRTIQIQEDNESVTSDAPTTMSLAAQVARLSKEDRGAFMDKMHSLREDMDFQAA